MSHIGYGMNPYEYRLILTNVNSWGAEIYKRKSRRKSRLYDLERNGVSDTNCPRGVKGVGVGLVNIKHKIWNKSKLKVKSFQI